MAGTDPHLVLSGIAGLLSLLALIACVATWFASRAKKVRSVEEQIFSQLHAFKARAEAVDTRIGEWQVTLSDLLDQVESFFERTVKERKRITQQNARAEQANNELSSLDQMAALPRSQQLQLVDEHFKRMGR